ncbi:DUF1707 SHOCT-like domain-containing protein [Rhodococcus sp. SGAir0479]|uniref:DUF1707 SHOCT-like domain-containing protein n=1 Tax=Rhodococcus sp. SGAir0479 TaxID=2567884 RepID=UPI0010CD3505|nr:DUF1707 domain-containing protein [Rhodococcus sp. SGAir0479]QCQ92975.1 DUF1707 domain-containing protein [Rhodococcus sp. SGAir0479]
MPPQPNATTRARDIDRAQTCGLLDAGYSEGQLDPTEYQTRTSAAMKAKTLGELRGLVADLQIPDHLLEAIRPPAQSAGHRPALRRLAAVAAAALVVVGGIVYVTTRGDDGGSEGGDVVAVPQAPVPLPITSGEPAAITVTPLDTLTADGIAEFLRQFEVKFGDRSVDELNLYRHFADFARGLPDQPHLAQKWRYQGGFKPSGSPSNRASDTTPLDLADLDVGELLGRAPALLNVPAGSVDHIVVRPEPITAVPQVLVYVEDSAKRSGHLYATLGGEVTEAVPFEGA